MRALALAALLAAGCGGVEPPPTPASLADSERVQYPHHALLAEHLFALAAELRRAHHSGEAPERVVDRYLAGLPDAHRGLGAATRATEARGLPPRVSGYLARARLALTNALDVARRRDPDGVSRASERLLEWLE